MLRPTRGDLLIRDVAFGYVVVDAVTMHPLGPPYRTIADAAVNARRLSATGHVWRQTVDGRGRPLGDPFLLELQPSTAA